MKTVVFDFYFMQSPLKFALPGTWFVHSTISPLMLLEQTNNLPTLSLCQLVGVNSWGHVCYYNSHVQSTVYWSEVLT